MIEAASAPFAARFCRRTRAICFARAILRLRRATSKKPPRSAARSALFAPPGPRTAAPHPEGSRAMPRDRFGAILRACARKRSGPAAPRNARKVRARTTACRASPPAVSRTCRGPALKLNPEPRARRRSPDLRIGPYTVLRQNVAIPGDVDLFPAPHDRRPPLSVLRTTPTSDLGRRVYRKKPHPKGCVSSSAAPPPRARSGFASDAAKFGIGPRAHKKNSPHLSHHSSDYSFFASESPRPLSLGPAYTRRII